MYISTVGLPPTQTVILPFGSLFTDIIIYSLAQLRTTALSAGPKIADEAY